MKSLRKILVQRFKGLQLPHLGMREVSTGTSARGSIVAGLLQTEPRIHQNFLYDDLGSQLYEQIVQQPEYYLPQAEVDLLKQHGASIAMVPGIDRMIDTTQVIIELGAGSGLKTMLLIEEVSRKAHETIYIPCDISKSALEENAANFQLQFAGRQQVRHVPLVGTHEETLQGAAYVAGVRTVLFMGSSVGNFYDDEILELLKLFGKYLTAQDRIIIAFDLPHGPQKDKERIETAYNDQAGVTAKFTLNSLSHVSRVASLSIDPQHWRHVARYDVDSKRILTHVEALKHVCVHDLETGQNLKCFDPGEKIFIEQSRKFSPECMEGLCSQAGLSITRKWLSNDYAIAELRPNLVQQSLKRSRWLFDEVIGKENLLKRPISLRNPFLFYLGHCAAFSDLKQLMLPGVDAAANRQHFERGIDPDVDDPSKCHSHSHLPEVWPTPQQLQRYEASVAAALTEQWQRLGSHSAEGLMCEEHTMMHHETLLYMVAAENQRSHKSLRPTNFAAINLPCLGVNKSMVVIPAGQVSLGASEKTVAETGFVWDNELPHIHQDVPTFQVCSHCITNAEFRQFVEDGGYQNASFWDSPEAASWAKDGLGHPLRWEVSDHDPGSWIVHTPLDGPVYFQDAAQWPAHVTLSEALAYCKWLGGESRLLTEAEYHRIFSYAAELSGHGFASAFRKSAIAGNNNFKFRTPTPVATLNDEPVSGVPIFDLCGNGWEWTSTVFAPLDKELFKPLQAYPQYSVDFFDGKHFVCLGGSMFTNLHTIRPSFRNFYQSRYPYGIHKFRVVVTL